MLDVIGENYRASELLDARKANPARKIIGTEYRTWFEGLACLCVITPISRGNFFGRASIISERRTQWPAVGAKAGLLDRTGEPRPLAFQRQSWWDSKPMVCLARDGENQGAGNQAVKSQKFAPRFADWSPADSSPHPEKIEIYSNCDEVELFLNGVSLGSQKRPADDAPRLWTVTYAPGELKASARNAGKEVATQVLQTAGPGSKIVLETDRNTLAPDWDDIGYVRATVVDSHGVRVPSAADEITFSTSGPGAVVAVDSGDLTSHEPFQVSQRKAFEGTCVALVRATSSTGSITVTATAPGLTAGAVKIDAVGADAMDSR